MTLKELAKKLGVEEYPEEFEEIYNSLNGDNTLFFNKAEFDKYEEKYKVLDEYYDDVMSLAAEIEKDCELSLWGAVATRFALGTKTREELTRAKFPAKENSETYGMLPIFPLLALVPMTVGLYEARGFSVEEIHDNFNVFRIALRLTSVARRERGFAYFGWSLHYVFCDIFNYKSFNFELRRHDFSYLLRNKKDGRFAVIKTGGKYHANGYVYGSLGCDEEGCFEAAFSETDEAFTAHEAVDGRISSEKKIFSKSEWECIVKPGDNVLSLHIPRNVDFAPEAIEESLDGGIKIAKERFSDYQPKIVFCNSWLLDIELSEMLGEQSRITSFANRFLRYQNERRTARGGFSFVFLGCDKLSDAELPEDTSLRRKMKAHYLAGKTVAFTSGFMTDRLL